MLAYDPDRALDASRTGGISGLSEEDEALLLQLLIDHRTATDSVLAARLLERWAEALMSFCRVAPKTATAATARPVAVSARMRA